jgi:tetratricopeptide (TPR) repeat protein
MKRLVIPVFLLLGACSSAPTRHPPPVIDGQTGKQVPVRPAAPEEEGVVVTPLPPAQTQAPGGGAVVALLDQAEDYHRAGDINNEAATIERALRIDSRNAGLWHRLAAVRLEQGRPQEAEQLALKSNALAGDNRALQVSNWQLVARARWSQNDSAGAQKAEQKARDLGG